MLEYIKDAGGNKDADAIEGKRNFLLMELNYGKSSRKTDSRKIDDFLKDLNVNFIKSSKENLFGDYFRMVQGIYGEAR